MKRLGYTAAVLLLLGSFLIGLQRPVIADTTNNRILYTTNAGNDGPHVITINPDGTGMRDYGQGSSPKFSPDEQRIAFSRNNSTTSGLIVVNADGTNEQNLTASAPGYLYGGDLSWSPDSSKIAFARGMPGEMWDIVLANTDASGIVDLTNTPDDYEFSPIWSPDGTKIVYRHINSAQDADRLYVMDADGSNPHQVSTSTGVYPSWAPNSQQLTYQGSDGITVVDSSGANSQTLTQGAIPQWSPDGTKITYVGHCGCGGSGNSINTIRPDGANQQTLVQTPSGGDLSEPNWSPDGTTIIFAVYDAYSGNSHYFLGSVAASGGPRNTLYVDPNGIDSPAWGAFHLYNSPPVLGTPEWSANPFDPGHETTLTIAASAVYDIPVTSGEYFIDTDPGTGAGTPMTYDGTNLSATFGSGLSTGPHTVGVRAVNAGGAWSGTVLDTLTVNPVNSAPAITSASTFSTGMRAPFDFKITTSGFHPPAITETGTLPGGITFTDNGDGTADLAGTAVVGSAGTYPVTLTATNASGTVSQNFTLTINTTTSGPDFTSATSDTEVYGQPFAFSINTSGYPAPTISKKGTLPGGITFTDNGDGTATLAGTPSGGAQGNYALTFTAKSGTTKVTQSFTLTITRSPVFKALVGGTSPTLNQPYTLTIATKGYTIPTLSITSAINGTSGLNFTDNGDGTATLSGTPNTAGAFPITFSATNQGGTVTKSITLKVGGPPTYMQTNAGFTPGVRSSYKVPVDGYPAPTFTITGTLPASIKFNTTTGTFSGKPTVAELGHYPLTLTATNMYGSITQDFMFNVAYPS